MRRPGRVVTYAGQYTDTETGLQYLRARYYDPSTGTFLTRDPLEAQTREPYGYAGGSPLNATDPLGLCWGPGCWVESAAGTVDSAWDATGGKAVSWTNDHTQTVGICGQVSAGFVLHFSAQGCLVADRHFDVGVTGSVEAGFGSPALSAGGGPMLSNAGHVRDLNGPYAYAGASGGEGIVGGIDATISQDCTGKRITELYPMIGVGFRGLPGFEAHSGVGRTGVLGTGPTAGGR
ncbi:MAG: hypothetical protein QOJ23_4853 [Actinomycetota bacterium]|jgi:RHS repeat-associated protein|nr:hypothetical protein [Actinomycetota bacterium]MDQ1496901.1 hypothetical protein [Actinomycetota bacterium]